jgi:8-amino-7-oxononanoate synthase
MDEEAVAWADRGLQRKLITYGRATPGKLERDGGSLISFASNDYLGLAADPRVVRAAVSAAERFGWGAGASPLVTGWRTPHQELADELAAFEQTEAAVLFSSGFAANAGAIAALAGQGDAVYCDKRNHACLFAGARLSEAALRVYRHADADRLESILRRDRGRFRRSVIATDGVFSMEGDLAPLAKLADLADRFGAMLLVDEAHATGVFGPEGRGASAHSGIADRAVVRVGTLSKALGSIGGFVAGSRRLVDRMVNHAATLIYSTALPPAAAAAAREALAIAGAEPWRREQAGALGQKLRDALSAADIAVAQGAGPIVAVPLGDPHRALAVAQRLTERGYLVPAIRPPTVPRGTSQLRISVSAAHTHEAVDGLVTALIGLTTERGV